MSGGLVGGKNFSNLWWFNGLMNRHEMEWRWFVEQEKTAKNASNQSQWLEHVRIIPFTSLSLDLTGPTVPFPTHSSFIVNGVSSLSAPTCLVVAWRWEERPKPMMDLWWRTFRLFFFFFWWKWTKNQPQERTIHFNFITFSWFIRAFCLPVMRVAPTSSCSLLYYNTLLILMFLCHPQSVIWFIPHIRSSAVFRQSTTSPPSVAWDWDLERGEE